MGMSFEEFQDAVKEQIRDVLPEKYHDAAIDTMAMDKINASYTALCVRAEGEHTAAAVDLDSFYRMYDAEVMDIGEVLQTMAERIQNNELPSMDMSMLRDYEAAKEKLYVRVCGVDQNEELLKKVPHHQEEDLAITCHLKVFDDEQAMGSILVTNGLLQTYGISREQLFQDAMENSQKILPMNMTSLMDYLTPYFQTQLKEAGIPDELADMMLSSYLQQDTMQAYIVTNDRNTNGAGALFYPETMDQIGRELGSDFIILPSSTHEMLVMPDQGLATAHEMSSMVQEVNEKVVNPEERLTNEAYHYDREAHVFEKFSSFEARMAEMERATDLDLAPKTSEVDTVAKPKAEPSREHTTARDKSEKPERKSVLKKLEQKKSEIKAREAGTEKKQGLQKENGIG